MSDQPDTNVRGEPPFYSATSNSNTTCYHTDDTCWSLNKSEYVAERSASYIEWHELKPCEKCFDDVEDERDVEEVRLESSKRNSPRECFR